MSWVSPQTCGFLARPQAMPQLRWERCRSAYASNPTWPPTQVDEVNASFTSRFRPKFKARHLLPMMHFIEEPRNPLIWEQHMSKNRGQSISLMHHKVLKLIYYIITRSCIGFQESLRDSMISNPPGEASLSSHPDPTCQSFQCPCSC